MTNSPDIEMNFFFMNHEKLCNVNIVSVFFKNFKYKFKKQCSFVSICMKKNKPLRHLDMLLF